MPLWALIIVVGLLVGVLFHGTLGALLVAIGIILLVVDLAGAR